MPATPAAARSAAAAAAIAAALAALCLVQSPEAVANKAIKKAASKLEQDEMVASPTHTCALARRHEPKLPCRSMGS